MRSRSSPLAVAAAALVACALSRPAAADAQADAALKEVAAATKAVQTLTADISMTVEVNGSAQKLSVDGSVQLKHPNLALIKLGAPFSATIASDGKTLYTVSAAGYNKSPADPEGKNIDAMVAIPVNMFFDSNNLGFTKIADATAQLLQPVTLEGTSYRVISITGAKPFTFTMKLFVSPDNVVTRMAAQISSSGQQQHLTAELHNIKLNQPLADTVFAYTPPANVQQAQVPDYEGKLVAVGKEAPNFTIPTPTGGQVSLAEAARGNKAVIVNFWFYGWGACREEFPHLQKLYHSLHSKGLELIAVNSNDDAATIKKYRNDGGFSFILGMDNVGKKDYGVAGKYGVQAYPTNYVVDPNGKVIWRGVGFDEDQIRAALAKLGVK